MKDIFFLIHYIVITYILKGYYYIICNSTYKPKNCQLKNIYEQYIYKNYFYGVEQQ